MAVVRKVVEESCETCRFWKRRPSSQDENTAGDCRRHDPVVVSDDQGTYETDWCVDFEAEKENQDGQ